MRNASPRRLGARTAMGGPCLVVGVLVSLLTGCDGPDPFSAACEEQCNVDYWECMDPCDERTAPDGMLEPDGGAGPAWYMETEAVQSSCESRTIALAASPPGGSSSRYQSRVTQLSR